MTTSHEYRNYIFHITYRPQDPAYSVDFPDIPDIITSGGSLGEAFSHACEALDFHLESLEKLGLPLPKTRHRLVVETVALDRIRPMGQWRCPSQMVRRVVNSRER